MLIVAPSGSTVEETIGLMPRFFSATDIETGRVAELEEVENATNIASRAPRKNNTGESLSISFMIMMPCIKIMCAKQPMTTARASVTTSNNAAAP